MKAQPRAGNYGQAAMYYTCEAVVSVPALVEHGLALAPGAAHNFVTYDAHPDLEPEYLDPRVQPVLPEAVRSKNPRLAVRSAKMGSAPGPMHYASPDFATDGDARQRWCECHPARLLLMQKEKPLD